MKALVTGIFAIALVAAGAIYYFGTSSSARARHGHGHGGESGGEELAQNGAGSMGSTEEEDDRNRAAAAAVAAQQGGGVAHSGPTPQLEATHEQAKHFVDEALFAKKLALQPPMKQTLESVDGPPPKLNFQASRPQLNSALDSQSPTIKNVIELTGATPEQVAKIQELWAAHEAARRELIANTMASAAPIEVSRYSELHTIDGEFEVGLVKNVLRQDQIDKLVEALRPGGRFPTHP